MAQLRWSPLAAADLEQICDFIGRNSPRYASLFAESILRIAAEMAASPTGGWMVPEFHRPEIRERLLGTYRLIFRRRGDTVELLTIVNGARQLPPLSEISSD